MFSYRFTHAISIIALLVMMFGISGTLTHEIALGATTYPPPSTPVFVMPTTGSMGWAWTGDSDHRGIDIWSWRSTNCGCKEPTGCNTIPGADVVAVYDGQVVGIYAGNHTGNWSTPSPTNPYPASVVILKHTNVPGIATDVYTVYQHLANNDTNESYVSPGLTVGQQIRQNEALGKQGNWRYYSDNAAITHLHFEVAYKPDTYTLPNRVTVDPMPYLVGGGQAKCSGATVSSVALPALKILRPSQANPVDVGTPGSPSKLTIEIAYAGLANLQDVKVIIGGKPASIINMTPNRYTIEVQPPQQTTSGSYDLTVSIKGASKTAVAAVSYSGASNADVILTLDRSGSMSTDSKMTAAHAAARQFVDLMQAGDSVGVVGFDDLVTTAFPLTMITNPPAQSSMVFADTMESGAGKWTPGTPWGLTSVAHGGSAAWTDSPSGNYANNANSILAITDPIAIPAPLAAPALSFWQRYDIENRYDYGRVEISTDNGASWQLLVSYTGANTAWNRAVIDLSAYRAQTIRLRFRLITDNSVTRDGWYIDDVTIGSAWVDVRSGAMAAIGTLTPRGLTSIGGGLQRGQQLLAASTGRPRAIILLSDGQENAAPFVADVLPQIRSAQTTVHTIGLGSDADQQQLLSIAAQTGGTYSYAPRPDQLAGIYNAISGAVSNRQTLVTASGTVAVGMTETRDVTIDSSVSEATFWVSWANAGAGVSLTLQSPSGAIIDPASEVTNTAIDYTSGATYAYYRVRKPTLVSGVWLLRVSRAATTNGLVAGESTAPVSESVIEQPATDIQHDFLPSDIIQEPATNEKRVDIVDPTSIPTAVSDEPFVARVLGQANLTLGFYLGKTVYLTTEPVACIVTLADHAPITGATVELKVASPNQATSFVTRLYDDGLHNDGAANDGVYAVFISGPREAGTRTFTITASGTTGAGEPFARQAELSTFIATNPNPYQFMHLPLVVR